MAVGTVKFFKEDRGWGALITDELPNGDDVFVHFSVIERPGFRSFTAGDVVEFDFEAFPQDSFRYRATRARSVLPGAAPTLRRHRERVEVVPDGTPDTPLTPKRSSVVESND